MDHIITTAIFLSVLRTALCFNIDPVAWKSWSKTAAGFGYKVMQRQSDLIVSAPLEQFSQNRRGRIYQCNDRDCQPLQVPGFNNMTLGLSMTSNPNNMNPLVCGPTIPKDCRSITLYSGACFEITSSGWNTTMPFPLPECRVEADIAFLLDGSGSVINTDFIKMKTFVKQMIKSFLSQDTKFSIVQFSSSVRSHYTFGNSYTFQQWEYNIDQIIQITGGTRTARAIRYVVEDIFKQSAGARENVKKILIVVTDGESQDGFYLQDSVNLAEQKKIIRFAIGVGRAFTNFNAKKELETIASYPSSEHVFQVENFDALDKIRQNLQDKIFSIEGSQSGGASLKLEMAQEGFSAAYGPEGFQIGIIGANQWRGGYMKYTTRGGMWSSYDPDNIETDSYMGYSITVATTSRGPLTIVGAPRYKHRGAVMTVHGRDTSQKIDPFPWQFQSGEYFGAEVCAMDVNGDKITDVILISAPMYKETDREGRVYVCRLTGWNVDCRFDSPLVLRGTASDRARFGSAIAVLPDINTDRLSDLAIGAPLENEGQGSIYIFNGEGGGEGIHPTYSQRIAGSAVQAGLKFFGQSISQLSFDHSRDTLPDLAVGSKGTVVLLRSQPIVMVEAVISFIPAQIPTQNPDCTKPLNSSAKVCFAMTKHSSVQTARANITFSLTLDATRKVPKNRAYISKTEREMTRSVIVDLTGPKCSNVNFFIESCPEDALNELNNELKFTFKGLPSAENLKPSLAQQAQTTTFHPIGFEINCGTDNKCVDNLKVDLNFTRSSEVKVGIDELVNVTVSVENSEENSYNSRVILTYPAGLSYRKFTSKLGRIDCNSVDSEDGLSRGKTDCTINKPIFKTNAQAVFIVSYGIDTKRELERHIFVTANATSGNQQHSSSSQLYKMQSIIVKYSIFVTIESSFSYNNFTFGKNDLQKPVEQTIVVSNDIRALNLTVVIKVPVKLGDKDIWVDPNNLIQGSNCQRGQDENPTVREFIAKIQEKKVVDCSVATCSVFRCSHFMGRLENKKYEISANISSGWLEQIGLSSAKYLVTSTASLEYDTNQYIFYSTGSNNNPPIHKIEAVVEVYTERSFTKEIIGGSLGGLALLALLTAGLYKAGFFKSKYNQMMNEQGGEGGNEGDAASPEE